MKRVRLGDSDLEVSGIGLGCMRLGDQGSTQLEREEKSRAVVQAAIEVGINFFDTSPAYGDGCAEEFLGLALRGVPGRDELVIATKCPPRTPEEIEERMSAQEHITRMLDSSLKRMNLDHIDLYIFQGWDYNTPLYDILDGLNRTKNAGLIRFPGISDCLAYQLVKANELASRNGFNRFVTVQNPYNLVAREDERELLKLCREDKITVTPYGVLDGGRLARPQSAPADFPEGTVKEQNRAYLARMDQAILARVEEISRSRGISMAQVSIAWLLSKGTVPIVGASTPEQVQEAAATCDIELTEEEIHYLQAPYLPHPDASWWEVLPGDDALAAPEPPAAETPAE
ncbi:MAG: aldo/keto reductase [Clostridia bacterium]|nr:aldo/keto reductase [Clostridia bacterium]